MMTGSLLCIDFVHIPADNFPNNYVEQTLPLYTALHFPSSEPNVAGCVHLNYNSSEFHTSSKDDQISNALGI